MHDRSTILTALLLSWIVFGTTTAQVYTAPVTISEEPLNRNVISIGILSAVNRTFSVTYSRSLRRGREYTINPLIQFPSPKIATQPGVDEGSNHRFLGILNPDPNYYYTNYMLRFGYRLPLDRHSGWEPQLQLGYGQFRNKVLKTEDSSGDAYDEYARLDRKYASVGLISMFNWIHELRAVRLKYFIGVGYHLRRINETVWNRYLWYHKVSDEIESDNYFRDRLSFHVGLEIGLRY